MQFKKNKHNSEIIGEKAGAGFALIVFYSLLYLILSNFLYTRTWFSYLAVLFIVIFIYIFILLLRILFKK